MNAGSNDLVIKVRLDTVQANQEWKKQESSAKQLGSVAGGGMSGLLGMGAKGAAAGLQFIFGEAAGKSWGNINAVGSNLGRSTFLGQQIEKDSARRNAWENSRAKIADSFGAVGLTASKEQILAMFRAEHAFAKREEMGKQRVESIIDEVQTKQTVSDVKYFFTHFFDVLREFDKQMTPPGTSGRPIIK
jgi:hypothetical protein